MHEFWVFLCPLGQRIEDAREGRILCDTIKVFSDSIDAVREALPNAVHIYDVSSKRRHSSK